MAEKSFGKSYEREVKPGIYLKIITFFTVKRFILVYAELLFTIVSYEVAICYVKLLLAIMAAFGRRRKENNANVSMREQKSSRLQFAF